MTAKKFAVTDEVIWTNAKKSAIRTTLIPRTAQEVIDEWDAAVKKHPDLRRCYQLNAHVRRIEVSLSKPPEKRMYVGSLH